MEREVFNVMFSVVGGVVGFEGHAMVAHGVGAMLAELGITTPRYLTILGAPVTVDCILFNILPWPSSGNLDACRFRGVGHDLGWCLRCTSRRPLLIRNKDEVSMSIHQ